MAPAFPTHRLDSPAEERRPFRLGIVIPLKSKSTARSWAEVEARLRATVASLRRQSSTDFAAVIVGHESPEFDESLSRNLSFVTLETPPPPKAADRAEQRRDKVLKKELGMQHLLARHPITHWFHLDADDLVHEHFVATVSRMEPFDIAVVRSGYAYYPTLNRYRSLDGIDRFCGSTAITSDRWWIDPGTPAGHSFGGIDHTRLNEFAVLRGVSIQNYPGRGVAYTMGHGDNLERTLARRARVVLESRLLSRRCDAEFCRSFGLVAGS
jgi:hypothetical protein